MNKDANVQLARHIVDLFYPLVEVTIFDSDGSLQEIFNAFSTLKEDQGCDIKNCLTDNTFPELLAAGRNVRCLIYPIHKEKKITGYLRIRYDLTHFKNLQEQLNLLVQTETYSARLGATEPWKNSIDQIITQYLTKNKSNAQATTAKQKRELVSLLQSKGLLDFKESSAYIASKLQISRATVYNYLKTAADFRKVHIHQVDAFTSKKFGGNPAGVVLDADGLDETTMRKIARELNLSETAFVSESEKGTFQMRYFTPTGHEIIFCGHSTVGALYMIAKERRFGVEGAGNHQFKVQTPCGIREMAASIDEEGEIQVSYEVPAILLKSSKISHTSLANAAGFDASFVDTSFPVMYEATNKDLFVVIRSLEELKKIECDSKSFANFSKLHDIVALCLLTSEAFDKKNQFHMRCFAPLVGIPEDPFTGSVLGGLTAYVDMFGLLPKGKSSFRVEQGHFIERPGVVNVEFSKKKENYRARVFAQAVHCFSTEINLT